MAYLPNNLRCIAGPENPGGNRSIAHEAGVCVLWTYKSSDAVATVRGANYFTDAFLRGMRAGDIVFVTVQASAGAVPSAVSVCPVAACTASGADLSDGSSMTVTNT